MQMDSRIILAGQAPDVAGSAANGIALAQGVNDTRRTNALRNLYQDQGAQIMAGDPTALNALAGFDPGAALGVRGTIDQQQFARNAEGRAATMHDMGLQKAVDAMSAEEAAAEAAALRQAIGVAATIQDPGTWDAFMAQNGLEDLIGTFENREQVLVQYMGLTEYIEASKGLAGIRGGGQSERIVSGEEAVALGLGEGAFNVEFGPNGQPVSASKIGGAGVNVTTNVGGEDEFGKVFARGDAEALQTINTAGVEAARNATRIDRLDELLQSAPTGVRGSLIAMAGNFGIPIEGLDDVQAATALINALVPGQRPVGSGPMSDADLELFKQSMPRIINQPGGNAKIIETLRNINEYDVEGARIVQQLRAGQIDRARAFELLQNRADPLRGVRGPDGNATPQPAAPAQGQGGALPPPPQDIDPSVWPKLWEHMAPEERELFK